MSFRSWQGGVAAVLWLIGSAASADTWSFDPTRTEQRFTFGESTIVQTTDATKNQVYPEFTFQLLLKGELQAQLRDVRFEEVFASDDNSMFVALSNTGLPGSAAMVFDKEGRIHLLAFHDMAAFDYCSESVTISKVWYGGDVKITRDGPHGGTRVSLRDCHGRTVGLPGAVLDAHARAAGQRRPPQEAPGK